MVQHMKSSRSILENSPAYLLHPMMWRSLPVPVKNAAGLQTAWLCQLDAQYLQHLMSYNKILQQRNGYLKSLAVPKTADHQLLDVYDTQLTSHGNYVFEQRRLFLQQLVRWCKSFYDR